MQPQIPLPEKIRLILIFALRYERDGGRTQVNQLLEMLGPEDTQGQVGAFSAASGQTCLLTQLALHLRPSRQLLVNGMMSLACESKRTGDLFGNKNLFARASRIVGGLKV